MASSKHTEAVRINEEALWAFLQNKSEWAQLVPGYLHHELPTEEEMIWVFKGDFGIVEKAVKLQLKVKEVLEGKRISFDLVGLSDNIEGEGYFEMEPAESGSYHLSGHLNMKAGGFLASMINPVLEKFVPQTIEKHVKSMAQHVSQAAV
ncbi:CoxG family protein [Lysinibacillus sp. 3P01SB]|uniref:CoxG family protein n=1 Tax=Lysinibacillus sp. 3P01SB TaxID=3132284 RepID=UPI0039A7875E